MIQDDWKLIVPASQNEPEAQTELYNLQADPTEVKNLADAEKERVEKMRAVLEAWWKGEVTGPACHFLMNPNDGAPRGAGRRRGPLPNCPLVAPLRE